MPLRQDEQHMATWIAVAAVAVLAIGVGVLSLLALERSRPPASSESVAPVPTFSSSLLPYDTASPTANTGEASTASASPAPILDRSTERFLSVASQAMWRGVAGSCDGSGSSPAPLVERSDDAGRTWADVTARYRQLAQLTSLDAFTPTEGQLVAGIAPECQPQALRTFTQGEFWEPYASVLATSSYIDLRDPSRVVTPTGALAAPCAEATGLRSAGARLAVICDGIAYSLGAASVWQPADVASAVALAFTDDGLLVAHTSSTCTGLAISLVVGADGPAVLGCAADVDPSGGAIAIATDGAKVIVWAADKIVDVAP